MSVFQAIVLGVIQGLTEFLPISSSAHLALAPLLFGWEAVNDLSFDVALHVGTLVAVLWYFRTDWIRLAAAGLSGLRDRKFETVEQRRALFLLIAVIPALVGGLLLKDLAETKLRNYAVMATTLIVLGIILWLVDRRAPSRRELGSMRWSDALLIGLAQVLALVPGVSRSGATMTAGRMLAFDRVSAARFSFLLSMPVILAAAVVKVPDALAEGGITTQLLAGTTAAAITGFLSIGFLLRFLVVRGYGAFALYRVVLGIIVYAILFGRN